MIKHFIYTTIITAGWLLFLCSCNGKTGQNHNSGDSLIFDSLKVDTTMSLTEDTAGPRCHIKLCFTYSQGAKADIINDSLLRSGILSPDFLSISNKHLTVKEAVDSFVTKYLTDYKDFYGDLYKADKNNSGSYNCEYLLGTKIVQESPDYYTYLADVYNYMGGAHGSSIVIARNISVKTGKIVTLKDIFVPGYEKVLEDAIIKKLCNDNKVKDIKSLAAKTTIFDGIDVYIPDNFIIGKKNITFIYSPDEIASHSVGEIRVEIDNDDIENLFKK